MILRGFVDCQGGLGLGTSLERVSGMGKWSRGAFEVKVVCDSGDGGGGCLSRG